MACERVKPTYINKRVHGDGVGLETTLQAVRPWVLFPMLSSGRTVALESTQPLTENGKVKAKESRNKPGVAQRVLGGLSSHIS